MKARVFSFLRVIISISLIGLLFYIRRDSLSQIIGAIAELDILIVISTIFLFFLTIFIMAYRFKTILWAKGLLLRFSEVLNLTFIGYFFNNFLPTAVGGDVVKAYYAYKKTDDKLNSFISVFMDRFMGFLSLFILAGASLIFSYRYVKSKPLITSLTIAVLFTLVLTLTLFFNRRLARLFLPLLPLVRRLNLKEKIERVYNNINAFRENRGLIAQTLLLSIAAQLVGFFIIYILIKGMGSFISLKMVLLLMPLVYIISMLPSINGLGIRESAIYFLFGPYVGYKTAFALSLVWLFMLFLVSVAGGVAYLFGGHYRNRVISA
ncbi:MAG: flippase-like domain-containing protein [Candidatus Omnitrophica bacterium]|nr:flippase-like domain-containing protein [Candidatus Omnitrophota bacterium]